MAESDGTGKSGNQGPDLGVGESMFNSREIHFN